MQALSQLSYGPNLSPGEINRPKVLTFLFVVRGVSDQIGDIVIAFFVLFDERSLFGLLHLDIVIALVAFSGGLLAAAGLLGIGVLQGHELDVGCLGLVFLRLGARSSSGGSGCRSGGSGPA